MAVLLGRSVFVHIPKTGGQWVAAALHRAGRLEGELGPVHATPPEIRDEPAWADRPHRFTFVRHPLSWYASMWSHRMDERWVPIDDPDWFSQEWMTRWADFTRLTQDDRFDVHLRRCLESFPDGWVTQLYRAYTDGCTAIGRQEQLQDDLLRLLRDADEEVDERRVRATPRRNTRGSTRRRRQEVHIDPELVEHVRAVESWVFEQFGYEPSPPWMDDPLVDGTGPRLQRGGDDA